MLVITFVHWGINALILYLGAISVPSEEPLPLLAAPLLFSVCALGVTLPSSPGFFGTVQYCFKVSFAAFSIKDPNTAIAASFYSLLMGYIPVTLTGLYFLKRLGMNLSSLLSEADRTEDKTSDGQ